MNPLERGILLFCVVINNAGSAGAGLGGGAKKRGGKSAQALRGSCSGDAASATRPQPVPTGLAPQLAL